MFLNETPNVFASLPTVGKSESVKKSFVALSWLKRDVGFGLVDHSRTGCGHFGLDRPGVVVACHAVEGSESPA